MKKLLTALVIIVSLGTAGSVCAADFRELRVLAEDGNAIAQVVLGANYYEGRGVTQDYKESAKWYRKSAEQGNAMAQFNLGWMYEKGQGVVQDYKEAGKWYRKSAEQGYAMAQYNLGAMYANGNGVIQDNVYAYMWFNIGASNGDKNAVKYRDMAAKNMMAADISKAQGLARACVAKKFKGC
jgi:TPR repeat protein